MDSLDETKRKIKEYFDIPYPNHRIKYMDESDIVSGVMLPTYTDEQILDTHIQPRLYWDQGYWFSINRNYSFPNDIQVLDLKASIR